MQNMAQTATIKSLAQTPHSARYTINRLQSNQILNNTENISQNKHRTYASTSTNLEPSPLYFEKYRSISTSTDLVLLERDGYSISIVNSLKQRIKTSTLIKRMYASRGYHTENISTFSHNPNQIIFQVSLGEITAGTVTLGIDSGNGLLADELYLHEINNFRKNGRIVCELSKFALDPQYSSKEIIATLFQTAYTYAYKLHQATDFFCEVNPRHVAPQKRMFGFRQIGELRKCPRVGAPAVLLHLSIDFIRKKISSSNGLHDIKDRSLYPFFIPQEINVPV